MTKINHFRIDITPQEAHYFSGYSRPEKSRGALDSLYLDTLILSCGEQQIFLISLDLLHVSETFSNWVTEKINHLYKQSNNTVIVAATHTHSGPAVFPLPTNPKVDGSLEQAIKEKLSAALEISRKQDLEDIDQVLLGTGQIEGIYGNRNDSALYADKSFTLLKLVKEGSLAFAVLNLACHSTILKQNNLYFSADLLGAIRKELEVALGCPVLVLNGASGDNSTRLFNRGSTYEDLQLTAKACAEQILQSHQERPIQLDQFLYAAVEESFSPIEISDPFWQEKLDALSDQDPYQSVLKKHIQNKFEHKGPILLKGQVLAFADWLILGVNAEVTSALAQKIYQTSQKEVMIIGCANGYASYLVEAENYGTYFESYVSRLAKGDADRFIQSCMANIRHMAEKG